MRWEVGSVSVMGSGKGVMGGGEGEMGSGEGDGRWGG